MKGRRSRSHAADIDVRDLRRSEADGWARASATVDGEELYFESTDVVPACTPELFATVLLPVAAQRGVRLRLDRAPDRDWRRNVSASLAVWSRWWGTEPDLARVLDAPRARWARRERRAGGRGLCFSLGVDSFHTLLRSRRPPDTLILAHGFDIPLADGGRMRDAERSLREVAARTGTRAVVVRTNVRRHSSLRPMAWPRTHGGSLAALGHACAGDVGELLISATKPFVADAPWGSHWDTDPGFTSSRLAVRHVGADLRRNDKIASLVGEPLFQRHLRVCWENRSASGNCGECEKCVRTMLLISATGVDDALATFPANGSLAARIDSVGSIHPDSAPVYERVLANGLADDTAAAVRRLLARSTPAADSW
jgi:hypothetical protein